MPGQKIWIVNEDPAIIHVAVPRRLLADGHELRRLPRRHSKAAGFAPENIAGVMMETYQGVGPDFAPVEYVHHLAEWCRQHDVAAHL